MKINIDKNKLGQRIFNIRYSMGLNLEEFGKVIKASKSSISEWEKGKNVPNRTRLKAIAKKGNISVNELLYGSIDEFLDNNLVSILEYQTGNKISSNEEYSIARQQFKKWLEERNITLENITNVYDYIDQDNATWTPWRVDMEYIKTMEEIRENMRKGTYSLITLIEMLTDKDRKRLFKHVIKMLKSYQLTDKDKKLIDDMGKRYD